MLTGLDLRSCICESCIVGNVGARFRHTQNNVWNKTDNISGSAAPSLILFQTVPRDFEKVIGVQC